MPAVAIRTLDITDIGDIAPLYEAIAQGLAPVYGKPAAAFYAREAPNIWRANLTHPHARVIGVYRGGRLAGVGVATLRGSHAEIPFLHPAEGTGVDRIIDALVRALVAEARARGARRIVGECVPLAAFDEAPTYRALGFTQVSRRLMAAETRVVADAAALSATRPLSGADLPAVADCLAHAYADDPMRLLHAEMRSRDAALEFARRVFGGGFGPTPPGVARAVTDGAELCGVLLAANAVAGVGFVLQLAVRPPARSRGLGARLVRASAEAMRSLGLERVMLGVSKSNPAMRLYTRLGFRPVRDVDAFVWENPLDPPGAANP